MKVFLIAALVICSNVAIAKNNVKQPRTLAQTPKDVDPKVNPNQPEPPTGTIVKPTQEQINSVPTATAAETEIKHEDTSINDETPRTPHLFGLHADLNVPHLVNFGLDYWHSARWFSASLNMGGASIPSSALKSALSDVDEPALKISNQELVARYHVFAGAFYLGLGYGTHTIEASGNKTISVTTPVPGTATFKLTDTIKSNYLTPHIGWMWKYDWGLTLGMDIGYMAQSNASVDIKEEALTALPPGASLSDFKSTAEYQKARKDLVDGSDQIGNKSIPYLALFRIGYMF